MTTEDPNQPPTDEPSLTEIDQLHRRAVDIHAQLPDLFYYATFRADSHPTEAGYDQWTRVRSLAGDLTGALNAVFGIPTEPEIQEPQPAEIIETTPRQSMHDALPELSRLFEISRLATARARTPDTALKWRGLHAHLGHVYITAQEALRAEKLDDALEGRGPDE